MKVSNALKRKIKPIKGYCIICNKPIYNKRKTCSNTCFNTYKHNIKIYSLETCKKLSESTKKLIKAGKIKPFLIRNITSYPESFWINVLNNNYISYIKEKHVGKYFLDFYIKINNNLIDLEIDGKQHSYKERIESDKIRDSFLKSLGYIVYRIKWNEINTENGKKIMKEKIEDFLTFIHSLM